MIRPTDVELSSSEEAPADYVLVPISSSIAALLLELLEQDLPANLTHSSIRRDELRSFAIFLGDVLTDAHHTSAAVRAAQRPSLVNRSGGVNAGRKI